MQNNSLPKDFITVEEAIELIQSDSREDAKVDVWKMAKRLDWVEAAHNFRIPRLKTVRNSKGEIIGTEKAGSLYVEVHTVRDAENLKYAIRQKYKESVKKELEENTTRGVSTVADDAEGIAAVQPRKTRGNRKKGDNISGTSSGPVTTNGEGLAV